MAILCTTPDISMLLGSVQEVMLVYFIILLRVKRDFRKIYGAPVLVYLFKERKNILKMNKEVWMLLPIKELITSTCGVPNDV